MSESFNYIQHICLIIILRVYDVCVSKGCIGLRDAEYLRRTTYQNLQRRAKEKYEKGLKIGMEHVNLSEVGF
jgi:hypothetical protein